MVIDYIPELNSDRLIYKPMSLDFASSDYLNWLSDKDVNNYLEVDENYDMDKLKSYIQTSVIAKTFFWAIIIKQSHKHIGNIKIDPINFKHGIGEYGIMMGDKSEWGKGYAFEASKTIIEYCFSQLKLRKVNLGVVEDNHSAVKLYTKLGFKLEGRFEKHGLYNEKYCDVLRMSLFNSYNLK